MERLPVAVRELRMASRRPGTYWLRSGVAAMALAAAGLFFWLQSNVRMPQDGKDLMALLSGVAFLFAAFGGGGSAAEAISSEVREGTLGFLFLTRLGPRDVLFGKLAASSLDAFYILLSILPMLGLPILLGGISGWDFLRMAVCLLTTLFWSVSLHLLFSTFRFGKITDSRGGAVALTLVFLLLMPFLGSIAGQFVFESVPGPAEWLDTPGFAVVAPFFLLSPATAFAAAIPGSNVFPSELRQVPVLATAVMGALFLTWANARLRHIWKDVPTPGRSPNRRGLRELSAAFAGSSAFRSRILDQAPLAWLALRRFGVRWGLPISLGAVVAAWIAFCSLIQEDWTRIFSEPPVWIFLSVVLHLLVKGSVSIEAVRGLHEDRKSGAIELLLSLPISNAEHVRQRMVVLRQVHLPAVVAILLLDLGVAIAFPTKSTEDASELLLWAAYVLVRGTFLVVDCLALAYHGLWTAASTRANRRPQWSLALVLGVPWGVFTLVMMVTSAGGSGLEARTAMLLYGTGSLLWSSFVALNARTDLRERFREVVVEHLRPAKGATDPARG